MLLRWRLRFAEQKHRSFDYQLRWRCRIGSGSCAAAMEHKDIDIVEEVAAAPKPPPPPPVAARTIDKASGVGKILVFLGKKLRVFNLVDLLRGSAEVLGNRVYGNTYNAALDS